jgi:hypothetical protein
MKKSLIALISGIVLLSACSSYGDLGPGYPPPPPPRPGVGSAGISIGFFYDYLSPFGAWVEFSPYGYVWCPGRLGFGWRPYTHGHWVWTDFGWTWISDFEWGWAPFHYGRWGWDDDLGWFWVPGSIWGPAWVTWGWAGGYVGWAPLPPGMEFVIGVGIPRFYRPLPERHWCFIEGHRFLDPRVRAYVIPFERNITIINYGVRRSDITVVNNRIYNGGIGIDEARRLTGRQVPRYRLEDAGDARSQRVGGGMVRLYRPPVQRAENARPRSFILRNEAPQRLREIRQVEAEKGGQPAMTPRRLQEDHKNQRKLLEDSQRAEREQIRRQGEAEMRKAKNAAEREKIGRDAQMKRQAAEKKQAEEKAQMERRHQEEQKNVVRRGQGAKPQSKPKKKDKGK